jgi:hypothetical protein
MAVQVLPSMKAPRLSGKRKTSLVESSRRDISRVSIDL